MATLTHMYMGTVADVRIDVHADGGVATVLALAVISLIAALLMVLVHVGGWSLARSHSAMVADIAAVSAARQGTCEAARYAVHIHRVELVDCHWKDGDAIVVVRSPISVRSPFLPVSSAQGRARAGF